MESLLAQTRRWVRERLLSSESDTETLYALGLALRELSAGWNRLPDAIRAELERALQSVQPLSDGTPPLPTHAQSANFPPNFLRPPLTIAKS